MTAPCTPFFNRSGGFGITGSPSTGWTFTKTAEASTAETIATFGISDDASSLISFTNNSATDGRFGPTLLGVHGVSSSVPGIMLIGQVATGLDSGTNPIIALRARRGGSTDVSVRPLLQVQKGDGSPLLDLLPLNSGANSALSWGTQAGSAPAFTTRSSGTRIVLGAAISGSLVDYAIGAFGGATAGSWYSVPSATSSYEHRWYAGTTNIATLRGDGQLTTTGSKVDKLRVALTTPVTVVAGTDYIVVSNLTTPGAVAVNLPATPATGLTYVIKDGKGDAAANNITITPAAGNIDGAGTLVIAANYGRAVLVYNGTEWNVIT